MNLEEINLIKLKELKLNDLINRKNEDRMTLIDTILSIEKSQFEKGKLKDEWINERWFELKTMDYKILLEIFVDLKLQKLTSDEIKEELEINRYADKIIRIYDKIFPKIEYRNIQTVYKQIEKLEENDVDILGIDNKIIYYIQRNKDRYSIGSMIEYLKNVYVFFKPELRDKYVVICYLDYDEIKYTKAKICGDIKNIKQIRSSKILDIEDLEGLINNDSDIIGTEEFCNCCKSSTKKTMNKIKSKFPKGTKFLMVSL